jgi:hypothetical protein
MEVFFDEEPIPLRFCPALAKKKSAGTKSSAWVLQTVKEICHFVGLLCEGFEEELLALFTTIEASHSHKESASSSKLGKRSSRELSRLSCSINYDSCSSASRGIGGKVKIRVVCAYL